MEKAVSYTENLAELFKVLSKPEAHRILFLTKSGIANSTYAIEELNISQKVYYDRIKGLVDTGLVKKIDGAYRQTALGQIICSRFLPAMGGVYEIKEKLGLLESLEGTTYEQRLRKVFADDLEILDFSISNRVRLLEDYEALAIEAIDLYDSAEESVLLASNYLDIRVMEATFRAVDRGVTNRLIMGKNGLSSKLQNLRIMLSIPFTKAIINFATNTVDLKEFVRFVDLPYTFCVVDRCRSIMEISNTFNEKFIVALSIDDKGVGEKLTDFYEMLWEAGEFNLGLKVLNSLKPS